MESQIYYIAALALIDSNLDELQEEFGDLPVKVKEIEKRLTDRKALVAETEGILDDVRKFTANSKVALQDMKTREEKLAKQQFLVRNNREFDAITREIEHIREEHNKLTGELRTVHVKEENLLKTLEEQKNKVKEAEEELEERTVELDVITSDQNEEVKQLIKRHKSTEKNAEKEILAEYNRIRMHNKDACVQIKKNSCSGCFSSVPPQKIVEIRNNLDKLYLCENCGRILYPEEIILDEELILG